jgi:hypothetical protein
VPSSLRRFVASSLRAKAFTFTEILFSVIILGIGFIMLAAIFPVALQQTKVSAEDTTSAAVSRSALRYMEDLGQQRKSDNTPQLASTGGVVKPIIPNDGTDTVTPTRWNAVSGNMIIPNDPRYAWVPLYSRAAGSPFAQVFIFVEQVRGDRAKFDGTDLTATAPAVPNLQARSATVTVTYSAAGSTIAFTAGGEPVGEGSFVITAANGHIYKVGTASGTANTWFIAPGYEPKDTTEASASTGAAFVVGRRLRDPTAAYNAVNNPYVDPVQDIGCYTSFVRVN